MPLEQDTNNSRYQIKAYEPGFITINEKTYANSLIIGSETLITDWPPQSLNKLSQSDLMSIIDLKPELVLLGTGLEFNVPSKAIIECFHSRKIGFEYMDTSAACRTFVALSAEGRNVVAGLLIN